MEGFRLFCFKQFFKIHLFCLAMMVVFKLFMHVRFNVLLWLVLIFSIFCCGLYLRTKPYMLTKEIYATTAISSSFCMSIIAQRFLWIALRIDFLNMLYFFLSMVIFAMIISFALKFKTKKKQPRFRKKVCWVTRLRYMGWGFFLFLFFYQLILSYLLRPNFLTVMALSISHGNLLLIMWTYFDIKKLYGKKSS